MMRLFVLFALCLPGLASATIGDPCPNGDECTPGEVCLDHAEGAYCTTRCPAGGCPDGYGCAGEGRARVCVLGADVPPPAPVGMGETCGGEISCVMGLFCATDGEDRYCSRPCWGPGTCPDGFRCTAAGEPACARLRGPPGALEPCSAEGLCAEGLVCVEAATRQRALCAVPCEDASTCRDGEVCQNEHCIPSMATAQPGLGEVCRDDAAEPSLAGCGGGLECHVLGLDSYCTQGTCDSLDRCPDGYGCVEIAPQTGACRRGEPDDLVFTPPPTIDVPVQPPPPSDATVPPPGQGGAGGGSNGGGSEPETGCAAAPDGAEGDGWWTLLLGLGVLRRFRS